MVECAQSMIMAMPNQPPKVHRSFTLPANLRQGDNRPADADRLPSGDAIEVLFAHSSGRIVSFSPPLTGLQRARESLVGGSPQEDGVIGVLPWASHTERTMASGSVAFLNSGKTLHPILKKSQCWCVDGETIFVLRIRGHNYYRIELPNSCEEDRYAAEGLKSTFAEISQYETTACPFQRGFHVELPEKQDTRKRPWRPKHRPITASPGSFTQSSGDEASTVPSDHENGSNGNTDDSRSLSANIKFVDHSCEGLAYTGNGNIKQGDPPEKVGALVTAFEELKIPTASSEEEASRPRSRTVSMSPARGASAPSHTTNDEGSRAVRATSHSRPLGRSISHTSKSADQADGEPLVTDRSSQASIRGGAVIQSEAAISTGTSEVRKLEDEQKTSFPARDHDLPSEDRPWQATFAKLRSVAAPILLATEHHQAKEQDSIGKPDAADVDHQGTDANLSVESSPSFHTPDTPFSLSPIGEVLSPLVVAASDFGISVSRTRDREPSHPRVTIPTVLPDSGENLTSPQSPTYRSSSGSEEKRMVGFDEDARSETEQYSSPLSSRASSPSSLLRRRFGHRRSHSPLPPSINLYTPRDRINGYHVTAAVLQRTCSLVLAPPARLVALMLNIAWRISNGGMKGDSSLNIESGRRIPCSWDSDEDGDDLREDDMEDDFGFSLAGKESSLRKRRGTLSNVSDGDID